MRIYDGGDAMMHAELHNVHLSGGRIDKIKAFCRGGVELDEWGQISTLCPIDKLPVALPKVLDVVLAVSHLSTLWGPQKIRHPFSDRVAAVLEPVTGNRLQKGVRLSGLSGHQIEFPFAIAHQAATCYIDTVSWAGDRLDWMGAYKVFGKMMDVDWSGMGPDSHLIIVEDEEDNRESQQVMTFLARCAPVLRFSNSASWLNKVAA